ncbi:hypothetical protein DCS_05768 [Drechmeria coniospora]|uniref:Uncharacterized protein n=1 Tax=Drechmeria coniospora TaxID=98403 RepID=A0A151GNT3_DRECN|nr:hypothetical protein DCS_05768 [Drechmeria coniospora]KYK58750.1 hypothetical protein DCS_05768 [Drechmeria coniospora]
MSLLRPSAALAYLACTVLALIPRPEHIPDPHYKDWPLEPEDLVGRLCVDKMAAACLDGQGCESACKVCLDDLPKGPEMSKAQCSWSIITPSAREHVPDVIFIQVHASMHPDTSTPSSAPSRGIPWTTCIEYTALVPVIRERRAARFEPARVTATLGRTCEGARSEGTMFHYLGARRTCSVHVGLFRGQYSMAYHG